MVRLVALLQPAQDRDRVGDRRLADEDRLEAPLERRVLLDVLAVLVERRRADRAQLAAREHRLEHVRRVDGALGGAGADDRVQLVDEEDDLARRVLDLREHGLEPLLELAAVLRAGEQRAEVERPDALALERPRARRRRRSAGRAPRRSPSCRRPGSPISTGLFFVRRESTWITRRISSSRPMTGSSLPCLGELGQVAAELLERLVRALGVLRRDALAAAHLLQRGEQRSRGSDVEREQQVLGRDVLVLELARLVVGAVEHLARTRPRSAAAGSRRPASTACRAAAPRPAHAARPARSRRARRACAAAPGRAARAAGARGGSPGCRPGAPAPARRRPPPGT